MQFSWKYFTCIFSSTIVYVEGMKTAINVAVTKPISMNISEMIRDNVIL